MTDQELLEAAAKAAGIEGEYRTEHLHDGDWMDVTAIFLADDWGRWNPLTSDGDALRLAVDLQMDVFVRGEWVEAVAPMGRPQKVRYGAEGPHEAARRAITLAAAF